MSNHNQSPKRRIPIKLILAAGIILFSLFKYWSNTDKNEWTGRKQHITLDAKDEIMLGLQVGPRWQNSLADCIPINNFKN